MCFRCILAPPYLACLKGDDAVGILFLVNLFDTNAETQSITINTIFGAGAQGPYNLESVPGDETVVAISADNGGRKRIVVVGGAAEPIPRDIAGDASLYVTVAEKEKVLLETTHKDGVNIRLILRHFVTATAIKILHFFVSFIIFEY